MDNLIQCARVLYDKDISDKISEIKSLKGEISKLKKHLDETVAPRILFRNHKEWHTLVTNTLRYIYNNVCDIQLHHPNAQYVENFSTGIWINEDKLEKCELFKNCLVELAGKNSEPWANKISQDVFSDLDSIINILKINRKYTQSEIHTFVYFYIHDKLCERNECSILAKIPQYQCVRCGEIYNDPYDSEDSGDTFEINEKCNNCYI